MRTHTHIINIIINLLVDQKLQIDVNKTVNMNSSSTRHTILTMSTDSSLMEKKLNIAGAGIEMLILKLIRLEIVLPQTGWHITTS